MEQPKEVVSERTDEVAEAQFIRESQVHALRDALVAGFDKGVSALSEDQSFQEKFKAALNTLIQNTVNKEVNVNNLKDLPFVDRARIQGLVMARMSQFRTTLEGEVGLRRDVSDVEDAKKKHTDFFASETVGAARYELASEGKNDAKVSFELKGTPESPKSVEVNYQKQGEKSIAMNLKSNEEFFANKEPSGEDSLAARARSNREAYLLRNVNYKISDPAGFYGFLVLQMNSLGVKDLKSLGAKTAVETSVEIVRRNLKVSEKGPKDESSDTIPIDQLLRKGGEGVCRHFTAAAAVVFEEIQKMAIKAGNENLGDITVFENEMPALAHASLAVSRGNDITVVEPYWYSQKDNKGEPIRESMDGTFDGEHGNLSSLFFTMSKRPEGGEEIFNFGNVEVFTRQSLKQLGIEVSKKVDDPAQSMLLRGYQVLQDENLQTPEMLTSVARSLDSVVSNEVLAKGALGGTDRVVLEKILAIGEGLLPLLEKNKLVGANQLKWVTLPLLRERLQEVVTDDKVDQILERSAQVVREAKELDDSERNDLNKNIAEKYYRIVTMNLSVFLAGQEVSGTVRGSLADLADFLKTSDQKSLNGDLMDVVKALPAKIMAANGISPIFREPAVKLVAENLFVPLGLELDPELDLKSVLS